MHRAKVGDRYVMEAMREGGYNLGGEQSGHLILSDFCTTGDGLVAALQVLHILRQDGRSAAEVLRLFEPVPQKLKSIRYEGENPMQREAVQAVIAAATARLNGAGRILVRPSGTEPVIRVMAEGDDASQVAAAVDEICAALKAA
jgi:phosphoglucosamine mutase